MEKLPLRILIRISLVKFATVIIFYALLVMHAAYSQAQVHIDHQFANIDAQSLIGLPMGSHKTLIDKKGSLTWSHWNLQRKPPDSPFGFSAQMDGKLAITAKHGPDDFTVQRQSLYKGRYPFVVTELATSELKLEELAFAASVGSLPGTGSADVVRFQCTNDRTSDATVQFEFSGKERNLPGHVLGNSLATRNGYKIVWVDESPGLTFGSDQRGLVLTATWRVPAKTTQTLWAKLPNEYKGDGPALASLSGGKLLEQAEQGWNLLWNQGLRLEAPQLELNDFFYSSLAYVMILTEYDAAGDLWALDGPGIYRQFWGRGEYFQARALEVAGHLDPARQTVEHGLHIQMDDGEWDGPPISGWPSWDNSGGNAAAVWDYYLYTGDKQWLAQAYPHLKAAAEWIRDHREETAYEDGDVPAGSKPVRRQIPWSCRPETSPPLQPGELPYWYGLLPWSYGDSGLPEGHSFPHNYLALYAVQIALNAANQLGHKEDTAWMTKEYEDYKTAILTAIGRSVKLEKETPPYLPAMPTYPEAAISQSFLAVYPTELFKADDPLISGLLARMERGEKQGLPTNVAWMGDQGVWPGEAMNMAEAYLLRGEKQKTADMLIAALNHSYTTNVWKEEIRIDKTLQRACLGEKKGENGHGTGDMPEAWANANLVNLLRDMLLREQEGSLHLLEGWPADWIRPGERLRLENAPVTLGGSVSYTLDYVNEHSMKLAVDPGATPRDLVIHVPTDVATHPVTAVRVNGRSLPVQQSFSVTGVAIPSTIEIELR